jgi:hypothetical protein
MVLSSADQRLAEAESCGFIFLMRTCVTVSAIVLAAGVFDMLKQQCLEV